MYFSKWKQAAQCLRYYSRNCVQEIGQLYLGILFLGPMRDIKKRCTDEKGMQGKQLIFGDQLLLLFS